MRYSKAKEAFTLRLLQHYFVSLLFIFNFAVCHHHKYDSEHTHTHTWVRFVSYQMRHACPSVGTSKVYIYQHIHTMDDLWSVHLESHRIWCSSLTHLMYSSSEITHLIPLSGFCLTFSQLHISHNWTELRKISHCSMFHTENGYESSKFISL